MENAEPPVQAAIPAQPSPLGPVAAAERVQLVDILRGFSIFGILLVNMALFFSPMYLQITSAEWWHGAVDRAASTVVQFLAQGKFYTLFSFLFGMGLAMQARRAEARRTRVAPFFARRMFWLLLIGLAHAFFVWFGDILAIYAIIGFPLLLFRNCKTRTLWIWIVILVLVPLLLVALVTAGLEVARLDPETARELEETFAENREELLIKAEECRRIYSEGTYAEILPVRARQVGMIYSWIFFTAPQILALFLVGLILGRRELFSDLSWSLPWMRKLVWWFLGLGLAGNLAVVVLEPHVDPAVPSPPGLLWNLGFSIGGPALCGFYVSAITLLAQREAWRRRLVPLAAVGRMALTNYLMHSIVFTTVANGYGLGLYGRISPLAGILLTTGMYLLQVLVSNWWLGRFRFGPVEWVWRSLTYLEAQPMLRRG